ncbi:MAG TPA: GGDEF domain-containing protein [Candidatus Polarisedimenticolaceae bacterium]|nr:GGDEF domain-containing protein [Candidatus Polarisedimenticolaceae bacterium]
MPPLAAALAGGAILLAAVLASALVLRSRRAAAAAAEEAASRASELAVLQALGLDLASARSAGQAFAAVDRECRKLLAADEVALGLVLGDGPEMTVHARAAAEREARLLRAPVPRDRRPSSRDGALTVPLVSGDAIVGTLTVKLRAGGAHEDRDLTALTALSAPVALAALALRVRHEATHDPLTGLALGDVVASRLTEELARAERHGQRVAVIMADLDGFRVVTERYGSDAADRFLAAAADALRRELRASDLVVRHRADAFCVLLPATGILGADRLAERMRGAIARLQVVHGDATLQATASFGVAAHPEHGATARTLLYRADAALHRAKRAGRDRVAIATV